ncbi:uncharacterized protein LOC135395308 [Ornithodoros turicata]|uniref:uncharacterized protein LOC135395308 n=1 Tax=Ornithodoros turicata TaxID=34597 RepID=UPI003138C4D8
MRHASSKKHVENANKHRRSDGVIQTSRQGLLDLKALEARTNVQESTSKAETIFALAVVGNSIPYTWGDVATMLYPSMFPDSTVASNFQCGRKKLSYIISDGIGPYFKTEVVNELTRPNVFFAIMIDDTPRPEAKVQQLDVLARYYSSNAKRVVVEHLESYSLGHATADVLLSCIEDALSELPKGRLLCVYSDGPNVMKSLKRKLKEKLCPNTIDISDCALHKVHNAFAAGLESSFDEVELFVTDIYHFFKYATRNADLKQLQQEVGLPEHSLLRHVSSRWLTLLPAVERILDTFKALKVFFTKPSSTRISSAARRTQLAGAFSNKALKAKLMFVKNAAQLFQRFETLFQSREPLIHVLYEEMVIMIRQVLGRFMLQSAFLHLSGFELVELNVDDSGSWRSKPELGLDTEREMISWTADEKKAFILKARSFYISCAKYLLTRLPLTNKLLHHLNCLKPGAQGQCPLRSLRYVASSLPQVVAGNEVSSLTDEWHLLASENLDSESFPDITSYWNHVFVLKRHASAEPKFPLLGKLVKAALCLPHGNSDCERGFSESKHALQHRSSISIKSISALRQTKMFLKRYDNDATKVPLTRELLKCVKNSYRTYKERLEREEADKESAKKRRLDADVAPDTEVTEKKRLEEEKMRLQAQVRSLEALLANAQGLINRGIEEKDMGKVHSGNVLLLDANSKLPSLLSRIEKVNNVLQKKR